MANELARLIVKLEAETSRYQAELEKANRKLDSFAKKTSSGLDVIKKGFIALGGIAVVGQLGQLVKHSIDAADSAAKMSQRLGVTVETLTGLRGALKLTGSSEEEFNKGLVRLSKSISDANFGLSSQERAFSTLGVALKNADGTLRSTEAVLFDIADAFRDMPNGAQKAGVAMDLMGRSAATLIPLLNQGSDGLRENIRFSEEMGRVWSDEAAAAAEEFNDRLEVMKEKALGVVDAIARGLIPAFNNFLATFGTDQPIDLGADDAAQQIEARLAKARASLQFERETLGVTVDPEYARRRLGPLQQEVNLLEQQLSIARNLQRLRTEGGGEDEFDLAGAKDHLRRLAEFQDALDRDLKANEEWDEAEEEMTEYFNALLEATTLSEKELQEFFNGIQEGHNRAFVSLVASLQTEEERVRSSYARRLQIIKDSTVEGSEAQAELIRRLDEQLEEQLEKIQEKTDEMTVFAEQAARNMQDAFADFLFDPFEDGIEGMLIGFINILRRMAAEAAAAKIFDAIFKRSGGEGEGANALVSVLGKVFGGGRAHGGPVDPARAYVVGERGPELFVPSSAGNIVPGAGGVVIHQSIDARGSSDPAALHRAGKALKEQTKAEIIDMLRRGR